MYRYLFSLIAAAFITIAIFFMMMALIRFTYVPSDPTERLIVNLQLPKIQTLKKNKEPRKKLTLEKTLSPPTSSGGSPPLSTTRFSSLPSVPRVAFTSDTAEKIDFNISLDDSITVPSPNIGNYKATSRTSGPSGTGIGLTNSNGSGKICTIGFSIDLDGEINELQWYNCMGKQISDRAETRLYIWIKENPDAIYQLGANPGEEIFVSFDNL